MKQLGLCAGNSGISLLAWLLHGGIFMLMKQDEAFLKEPKRWDSLNSKLLHKKWN